MSVLLTGRTVAERSLRKISAYSINDTGADPEEMREALSWLDMIVAELAGTKKLFWLVEDTIFFDLDAGDGEYDVVTEMGANAPDNDILAVTHATLRDSAGIDTPLKMYSRTEYEELDDKDRSGVPCGVYIDRLTPMKAKLVGIPTVSTYDLGLTVITYPPDITLRLGGQATGFAPEWNSYLVTRCAAECGDGPVRRLPVTEIRDWRQQAEVLKKELLSFSNREQRGIRARRTAAW